MYYIVKKQSPMWHQMTLEELLFEDNPKGTYCINSNTSNTKTTVVKNIPLEVRSHLNTRHLIDELKAFNIQTADLRKIPRKDLYEEFHIPKRSGGLRKIDAPKPELMNALRNLKTIFEEDFNALYHTSAFAYVKHRSTIDAVKKHQSNNSKWFAKYDLTDFFGSTTLEFVMSMLSKIFPFCEVINSNEGKKELEEALELAFLDGGLPQGTPISPLITNIIMIPIDFSLCNKLRDWNKQKFIYTRYADDFLISSQYDFKFKDIEKLIVSTLDDFNAPFKLKPEKTRYGSSAGSNWNLGVMLNKDNQITIGHKKKRQFQAMLTNYCLDRKNNKPWDIHDTQVLSGYISYYKSIEGETIDNIIKHIGDKFEADIMHMIKEDLS